MLPLLLDGVMSFIQIRLD